LWREYQSSDISPDYSREDYQEAYLLCYFLPYSQPVPYLLNQLVLKKNFSYQLPEDGLLTASFFGCGPGPELLGLMRYLAPFQPCINISAAMFDRESWELSDSAYVSSSIDSVEKIKPVLEVIPKELATNFLTAQRSNSINSVEFIWVAIGKK
jgi:hypothetical protein